MPSLYPLKINSTIIKTPTTFQISKYNLTKHGRLANGDMTLDLLVNGKKKKLFLTYGAITGVELQAIIDLMEQGPDPLFFEVTYFEIDGTEETITCYVGEVPALLQRRGTIGDSHVFKDVEFNFIQQ